MFGRAECGRRPPAEARKRMTTNAAVKIIGQSVTTRDLLSTMDNLPAKGNRMRIVPGLQREDW